MKNTKHNWLKIILLSFTLALFLPCFASAADYYADTDSIGGACSDLNSGTINQPRCTINKANQELQAGDSVYLREGIYAETISPVTSGQSGNRITYTAYNSEVVKVIRYNGANINGKSYITIDGITF